MPNKENTLRSLGCVVKAKLGSLQEECSACGVLLNLHQGIILSHGSILAELCLKDKSFFSKVKHEDIIRGSDLHGSEFEALVDSRWSSYFLAASPVAGKSSYSSLEPEQHTLDSASFFPVKCKLLFAFRNEEFFKAVARIMPSSNWTFIADSHEDTATECSSGYSQQETTDTDETGICFNLLSYFLVLKIQPLHTHSQSENISSAMKVSLLRRHNCHIGDVAEIVATPFGSQNPAVFFNTYSRGVVCNVSGAHGCWILTDARCIPGSEGGPLFTGKENQARHLTGIIAASLCWKNKEWIGFSLACSLSSIFSALDFFIGKEKLRKTLDSQEWIEKRLLNRLSLDMEDTVIEEKNLLLSSTVLVRVGSTWGSGVVLDKEQGILLTCSHVIKDSHSFDILIKPFQGSPQYKAALIYRSPGSISRPYDIAVLKCPRATADFQSRGVPKISTPKLGEKVYVAGHALFSTDLDLQPSLCAGVISKVIAFQGQPVMVQSTCAVHPGASGGPLLNSYRDLVGIVVCNTVDKGSNSCYPHINMSIPAISLWPALQEYLRTGDTSGFSRFEIADSNVKRLWALDNCVLDEADNFDRSKL